MTKNDKKEISKTRANAAERREKEQKQRELRAKYDAQKKEIVSHEDDNYGSLYVLETHDGWWKMFGHSAIFYAYDIGPQLGKSPRLLADSDFRNKENWGVVTIRSIDLLEQSLKKLKIEKRYHKDGVAMFTLNKTYTPDELTMLRRTEELKWEAANKLIAPKVVMPELYKDVRELTASMYEMVRKFVPAARELVGNEILECVNDLSVEFVMAMNEWANMRMEVYVRRAFCVTEGLQARMELVMNLKLTDAGTAYKMTMKIVKLKKRLEKMMLDAEREEAGGDEEKKDE